MIIPKKYQPPIWKHYLNTEYILIDFSGLETEADFVKQVADAVEMGMKRPDNSIRALMNVKGLKTTPKAIREMSSLGKKVQPKIKKSALVGSSGFTALLLKIYVAYTSSKMKFFTDKKLALEYLIQDS